MTDIEKQKKTKKISFHKKYNISYDVLKVYFYWQMPFLTQNQAIEKNISLNSTSEFL